MDDGSRVNLETGEPHFPGGQPMPKISDDVMQISKQDAVAMYAGPDAADKSEKEKKFVALYKSRYILSMIGTMEERRVAKRMLSRMKKLGLSSL